MGYDSDDCIICQINGDKRPYEPSDSDSGSEDSVWSNVSDEELFEKHGRYATFKVAEHSERHPDPNWPEKEYICAICIIDLADEGTLTYRVLSVMGKKISDDAFCVICKKNQKLTFRLACCPRHFDIFEI